jgi:hypothetical protein
MALPQQHTDSVHHCLPRIAQPCPSCSELMPIPSFCGICGEEITTVHQCRPRPLAHICTTEAALGHCLICGEPMPTARFCLTCGGEITPSHQCSAASATVVRRRDPLHRCPVYGIGRCASCGGLLPARSFCGSCGMEITPPHTCSPPAANHVCSPLVTMPRRCAHCGETFPQSEHCPQCGVDLTSKHVCSP